MDKNLEEAYQALFEGGLHVLQSWSSYWTQTVLNG